MQPTNQQSTSTTRPCVGTQQALVRWGGALLELAHFKQGSEADTFIQDVSAHEWQRDSSAGWLAGWSECVWRGGKEDTATAQQQ
jgi:hypothetical protein